MARRWSQVVVLSLGLVSGLAWPGLARAQDLATQAESLKFVPADVSAYSVMLRNGEQIDAILKSKAWAKLMSLPLVKKGWQKFEEEWHGERSPLTGFRKWYEQPDSKKLLKFLGAMAHDEIFVASGSNITQLLDLCMEVFQANQFQPLVYQLQGRNPDLQTRVRIWLDAINQNLNKLVIPEITIGFRVPDGETARAELQKLEAVGNAVSSHIPFLKGRLKRAKINGQDFLTLRLDGEMLPWDQIALGDYEDNPGEFDNLVKKVKSLKLTLSIGVRDNFLLLTIGESAGVIAKLGQGQRLAERPELQRLSKFADRKLIEIGYASKEIQGFRSTRPEDVEEMGKSFAGLLKKFGVTPEQERKIRDDLKQLRQELRMSMPEPGAQVSVGFLTDKGAESYTLDWTKNSGVDASKPLTLLHHVGKSPLLAVIVRHKYQPEAYAGFVKWVKVAHSYVEELAIPKLDEMAQDLYKQAMTHFGPLFKRLDKTTGEMLLPALADGQFAFVLDAKLKSKQWHMMMPESEKALPMIEPALVFGVKDAELLKKAMAEYRDIGNKAIEAIGQIIPIGAFLGEIKIPPPESKQTAEGTIYWYSIPPILGLDTQIQPTAGLSKKVAVLAISHDHAARVLKKSTVKAESGLLSDSKKPLAAAIVFDWEGLVHAAGPWLDLALRGANFPEDSEAWIGQIKAVVDLLTVLRSYTSVSYMEDGVLVTHGETIFRDFP